MKRILILILIAFLVVLCTTFTVTYIYRTKAETVTYTFIEDGQEMSFNMDIIDELTCNVYAELGDERLERNGMFYHYDGDLLTLWYFDDKDKMVLELTFDENNVIVDMNDYVDEYHMTMEEMAGIFNEKYAELNAKWAELKESQVYTMIMIIAAVVGSLILFVTTCMKGIKNVIEDIKKVFGNLINKKEENEKNESELETKTERLERLEKKFDTAIETVKSFDERLIAIGEAIKISNCNDREKVINGTAKTVCDLIGDCNDVDND